MDFKKKPFFYDPKSKKKQSPLYLGLKQIFSEKIRDLRILNRCKRREGTQTRKTHPNLQGFFVHFFFFFKCRGTATNMLAIFAQISELSKSSAWTELSSNPTILLIYFFTSFCDQKIHISLTERNFGDFRQRQRVYQTTLRCACKYRIFAQQNFGGKNRKSNLKTPSNFHLKPRSGT